MILYAFKSLRSVLKTFHRPELINSHNYGNNSCKKVGNGTRIEYSDNSDELRKDNQHGKKEDYLSGKGKEGSLERLADRGKEGCGDRLDTVEPCEEQENPEILYTEFKVELSVCV